MTKRKILWLVSFTLPFVVVAVGSSAQDTQSVHGRVTAIEGDTVTIQAGQQEMAFKVDQETDVIAVGAGTQARQAEREGRSGPKLGDLVKVGDGVEVRYRQMENALYAVQIRSGVSVEASGAMGMEKEEEGQSVSGHVTAVSADSISVKSEDKEWVFSVTGDTKVVARGAGTMDRQLERGGKGATLTDFVKVGDPVVVKYREVDAKYQATEIAVRRTVS